MSYWQVGKMTARTIPIMAAIIIISLRLGFFLIFVLNRNSPTIISINDSMAARASNLLCGDTLIPLGRVMILLSRIVSRSFMSILLFSSCVASGFTLWSSSSACLRLVYQNSMSSSGVFIAIEVYPWVRLFSSR